MEENKYKNLFKKLQPAEVPAGLKENIMSRVRQEVRLKRAVVLVFAGSALTSLFLLVRVSMALMESAQRSGFWQYLSLAFSDYSIAAVYWRELLLSLVESLPMATLTACLALVLVSVWTFANIIGRFNVRPGLSFS